MTLVLQNDSLAIKLLNLVSQNNNCTSLDRIFIGSACECKEVYSSYVTGAWQSSKCTTCDVSNTFRMD